jgi:hypothetical protein
MCSRPDPLPLSIPQQKTYTIVNTAYVSDIVSVSATETNGAVIFTLGSLDNSSAITALFDQYRILQVSCEFAPTGNVASAALANNGELYTALDYDDATAAGASTLRQYNTCVRTDVYSPQTRTLTPRIAYAAYNGSGFAGYAIGAPDTWINSSYNNVQHYAVKYCFSPGGLGSGISVYGIRVRYVLQVRLVK